MGKAWILFLLASWDEARPHYPLVVEIEHEDDWVWFQDPGMVIRSWRVPNGGGQVCVVGGGVYSCPRESRMRKTPWKERLGTGQLGRGRRMGGWEGQASSKTLEVPMRLGTPLAPAP